MATRGTAGETLADLLVLAQRRQGVKGGRALDRRATELGHRVSHTTLNKIMSGTASGQQNISTLDAIAALAEVSRTRVHAAAGRPAPGKPFAAELPPESDLLSRRQRDVVLSVVRALLDEADATSANRDAPPLRAVARRRSR